MNTDGGTARGIDWKLIAPGALLLLLGLSRAGLIDDPNAFMPAWAVAAVVAVGGALLLVGLIRTFRAR